MCFEFDASRNVAGNMVWHHCQMMPQWILYCDMQFLSFPSSPRQGCSAYGRSENGKFLKFLNGYSYVLIFMYFV